MNFQVDTGAQCNVVPLELHKKATKEHELTHMMTARQKITAYGGSEIQVMRNVLLRVSHGDIRCQLDCEIVDKSMIRPLLARKACLGMKIVAYLDTDKLFTRNSEIYALSSRVDPFTMEQLIRKYLQVLSEGVG